ncbi:hypothetical protein [Mesorhizobium hungaricum]|jgi:hypothetical protein|uniref:hypothetical protein n=1 Tax=Mesorhizobium TaxID=68287 RepID=UPI003159CABE
MRYAHRFVKSKRISITCKMHTMAFDDRPDQAKRLEKARVNRGFRTAKEAARFFGWTYETYIQHEQGIRGISRAAGRYAEAFRVGEGWLLTGEGTGGPPPKISGERAVKDLLRTIENLPEAAVNPLWRLISGYLEDAGQSEPTPPPDQTVLANRPRTEAPSR